MINNIKVSTYMSACQTITAAYNIRLCSFTDSTTQTVECKLPLATCCKVHATC